MSLFFGSAPKADPAPPKADDDDEAALLFCSCAAAAFAICKFCFFSAA
eukprot:CAMPEP_0179006406 /NCGR_PEP_ID=MMETSP0795-20121207/14527_1 /TAXON_ID=88552 /ORGANISM="Amoebophrya sp., Strain Ameob2" /LENGTH=47 /DNA_ID= /DNA_START= /DNA_END= /DNA_ORIENTATION=